jgi:hypothetical protein
MATAASSSSSDDSQSSDYSVNSGYDSDVVAIPDVPGILPYQYEPAARENIGNEANLQLGVVRGNRAGTTTW